MASQLKRIEYLEEVFRRSSLSRQSPNCICFPEQQPPCFLYAPVYGIAAAVLCTIHVSSLSANRVFQIIDYIRNIRR